jgi:hypothetical protein
MAARRPLTPDELTRLRELHAAGATRNAIGRELGRSASTVSAAAAKLGLSFDRSATAAATAAAQADAKALRAQLELDYLHDAQRARRQVWLPCEYIDHGGKDFVRVKWKQAEPTPADKLRLMQASKLAADASLRLAQHDATDTGTDGAKSMLGALAAGLRVAYDQLEPQNPG